MPSQQDQQTPGLAGSFLPAMMAAVMAEIMGAAAAQITAPSSTPVETINSANSFTPQLKPTTVSPAHSDQHNSKNSRKRHLQEGTRGKANTKEMSTKDVGQLQVSSDAFSNGLPSTSEDKSNEAATDIATDLSTNAQPNESATHKIRKLKLYSVEEKIDIIGAWRQIENPENVSNDADQAIIGHHFERANPNVIKDVDAFLIDYVNNNKETVDWYTIRDKANEKWVEIAEKTDEYSQNDMTISMGWVARFMSRCQESIPKVPPPIIATANAAMNAGLGNVSMVRCGSKSGKQSGDENGEEEQKIRKRPKKSSQSKAAQLKTDINSETPDNSSKDTESVSSGGGFSRRKCRKPMRVENATLLLNNEHVSNHNDLCAADEKAAPKSLNGNAELLDVPRNVNGIAMDFSQTCNALAAWLMSCNAANGNLIAFADSRK
ncbi:hypothetical protein Ddc_06976 [Ditylenchus destructor]|nr:hypothetical protein Ddc_06976 [Ditylenchus destructor]